MLHDLGGAFKMEPVGTGDPALLRGLGGRITFYLKQNHRHEILHTVQVERNGFIESLLSGAPQDERRYKYFAARAYTRFIAP